MEYFFKIIKCEMLFSLLISLVFCAIFSQVRAYGYLTLVAIIKYM